MEEDGGGGGTRGSAGVMDETETETDRQEAERGDQWGETEKRGKGRRREGQS